MDFGDTAAHLSLFAVKPSHQRCGIGRQMMAWLEEAALIAGITTINLELRVNNFAARTFYRVLRLQGNVLHPGLLPRRRDRGEDGARHPQGYSQSAGREA